MNCIVEAARAGSITAAAQTLAITQPALTRTIAEVEEALAAQLFERHPRGIELTDAGEIFVARARQILGDVDDLLFDLREGQQVLTGRVRLGVAPRGYQQYAAAALVALARAHPGVTVEIVTGTAQTLCPRLLRGELNLILGSSSHLARWPDLLVRELAPTYFACLFRRDHPIRSLSRVAETDVFRYPVAFPESVEPAHSDLARRYAANGLPPLQPRYASDDFGIVQRLVAGTDAYHPLTHPAPDFGGLGKAFFLLTDVVQLPTHHISIARAPQRPATAAAEQLEKLLRSSVGARGSEKSG